MAFVQRQADQQRRHLCFKIDHLDDRYRNCPIFETRVILETFKEHHQAFLQVLWDRLVLATADLQRTLQAFHEFRSHVNKMGKQHGRTRQKPPKKNSRKKLKHPGVDIPNGSFQGFHKNKVLVFVRFDSCPSFVVNRKPRSFISFQFKSFFAAYKP